MDKRDLIGSRGESIFEVKITNWCGGTQLFHACHLGDKHELHDYKVDVLDPPAGLPFFFVQVKSCGSRYRGKEEKKKLIVNVTKEDIQALKECGTLSYIAGVDIHTERVYILGVTPNTPSSISGIPVRNQITKKSLIQRKNEVLTAWAGNHRILPASRFV